MGCMERIEGFAEFSVSTSSTHKLEFGIEEFAIGLAAIVEIFVVGVITQHLCHPCHSIVGNGIFKSL